MSDDEIWCIIQGYLKERKGKGNQPQSYKEVKSLWTDIMWEKIRLMFERKVRSYARERGFELFLEHDYPNFAQDQAIRSTSSYSGRRKVNAGPKAQALLGPYRTPIASSSTPSTRKRKRPCETQESQAKRRCTEEDDVRDYIQPSGLMMTQPGRLTERIPTASFGDPWNPSKHPTSNKKHVPRQRIDGERVKHWSRETRRCYMGQNGVMGCSALWAATAANVQVMLRSGTLLQWEWLHLCAFKLGGIDNTPQLPDNLVAGTYDCNTAMITLENTIKKLALEGHVFFIEVVAHMYPGTHLAMQIDYTVECNNIKSKTSFYPMSTDDVIRGEIPKAIELFKLFFKLGKGK